MCFLLFVHLSSVCKDCASPSVMLGGVLPPTGEETSSWKDNSMFYVYYGCFKALRGCFWFYCHIVIVVFLFCIAFCHYVLLFDCFMSLCSFFFFFFANVSWRWLFFDLCLFSCFMITFFIVAVFILFLSVLWNSVTKLALCLMWIILSFFQHYIQKCWNILQEFINWSFRESP